MATMALGRIEDPQPGDVYERDGRMVRVASNGALMDVETGKIVAPPPVNAIASSERGRELAYARWHKPRQDAILAAVREATGDEAGQLYKEYDDADGYLTKEIVQRVILDDSGHTRGADKVKAWEAVMEHSGTSGRAPKQAQQQPQGAVFSMDRGTAAAVMAAVVAELAKQGVIDG